MTLAPRGMAGSSAAWWCESRDNGLAGIPAGGSAVAGTASPGFGTAALGSVGFETVWVLAP